jgi:hypothetical protein
MENEPEGNAAFGLCHTTLYVSDTNDEEALQGAAYRRPWLGSDERLELHRCSLQIRWAHVLKYEPLEEMCATQTLI